MSISEFKEAHHDEQSGCKELNSALVICGYPTTIASVSTNAIEFFLDGKLMMISISFQGDTDFAHVMEAMKAKFGPPNAVSAPRGSPIEPASSWQNETSVAQLQPHMCAASPDPKGDGISREVAAVINGEYCTPGLDLGYSYSRLLYVYKPLATSLQKRVLEASAAIQRKADDDLCAAASCQSDTQPYAFKKDRLGMSISEFQTLHHDPGYWTVTAKGKVWNPETRCSEQGLALTVCSYTATIASVPASVDDTFLDGKLMMIGVSFPVSQDYLNQVAHALKETFPETPTPTSSSVGSAWTWQRSTSLVQLQPYVCAIPFEGQQRISGQVATAISGQYCRSDEPRDMQKSQTLYIDKQLATALPKRLSEEMAAQHRKANGDL